MSKDNQKCPNCNTDMKYIERENIWDQQPEYKCSSCDSVWDEYEGEVYKWEIPF